MTTLYHPADGLLISAGAVPEGWIVIPDQPDPAAEWDGAAWVIPPPPPPAPPGVPQRVSRFQARVALMDAGLLADVETALAGAGVLEQMAWAEAVEFRRASPMIEAIAAGLGLTAGQVDDLFRAAALIEV